MSLSKNDLILVCSHDPWDGASRLCADCVSENLRRIVEEKKTRVPTDAQIINWLDEHCPSIDFWANSEGDHVTVDYRGGAHTARDLRTAVRAAIDSARGK
jgi:hypothetical protein